MDDQSVAGTESAISAEDRTRGLGTGSAAGLVIFGMVFGLAIGWVAWHGGPGSSATAAGGTGPSAGSYVEGVDVSHDPIMGPDDAPVTIVEFSDFECPFCQRFATRTAPLLRRQYGENVRWIFVNLPLQSIHPRAYDAALAGECVAEQGMFWDYYDALFSGRWAMSDEGLTAAAVAVGVESDRFTECFQSAHFAAEVAADLKESRKFYILGTPTFFVNGRRLEGAQPPEAFAAIIDSILSGS
jgi:protein-disulfide isomerase